MIEFMSGKTIKKLFLDNILIQIFLKIPEIGISLISVYLLARYLTILEFGIYSFVVSFVTLLSTFMDFGMTPILTREVSRNRSDAALYIGNAILLRGIFYIIFFVILVVASVITIKEIPKRILTMTMALSYLSFPLSAIFSVFYSEFKAWLISAYYVCKKFFFLIGVLITILLNMRLKGIIFGNVIAENLSVVIFFILAFKFIKPVIKFDLSKIKYLLREGFPLFVITTLGIIYTKIDTVMLSFLCSDIEVGIYSGAVQIYNALFFIPAILNSFFFPLVSKYSNQKDFFEQTVKNGIIVFAFIGLLIAILAAVLSKPAIVFLLSRKYLPSVNVFNLLCIGIPFAFMNIFMGGVLVAVNKQNVLLTASVVSYFVNIVGNLLLIPVFKAYGAAASTVVSQVACFCVAIFIFLGLLRKK